MFTKHVLRIFKVALIITLSILAIRFFIVEPGTVNGRSMEPTFFDNEFFLVNKLSILVRDPKRGEIAQLHSPLSEKVVIKRIAGLPGEIVSIRSNKVFITTVDGKEFELEEPYTYPETVTDTPDGGAATYGPLRDHEYFVIGDHREESTDSRDYGPVHRTRIYGTVMKVPFLSR